jgi:hypothetical protein
MNKAPMGNMEMHGVMAEYSKDGRFLQTLSIVKRAGAFEIIDDNGRSICGRHPTMQAVMDASLKDDDTANPGGLK